MPHSHPLLPARLLRAALATALLILLNACSSTAPRPQAEQPPLLDSHQHRQQLSQLQHWLLEGKIGLRHPDNSGSANLQWQQRADDYRIHLSGPLGQGASQLRGSSRGVTLEQAGQPTRYAASAEQLLTDSFGWQLPVSHLYYWVRGIPSPLSPIDQQQQAADGTLQQLRQSGWQLSYSRFSPQITTDNQPLYLPGKIVAQRDQLRLKLIIKRWQLTSDEKPEERPEENSEVTSGKSSEREPLFPEHE